MEVILYRNKRVTYSIDKQDVKSALSAAASVEAALDALDGKIICARDGLVFERVQGEARFRRDGGEVIERGVKEDLAACREALKEVCEDVQQQPAAPATQPAPVPVPASAAPVPAAAADAVAAGTILATLAHIKEEEIFGKVCNDLDAFIMQKYGKLPQKEIVVKLPDGTKRGAGSVQHEKFETVLKYITADVPVFLAGPAGTGKSSIAKNASAALGMEFYFSGAVTDIYKFTGFIDAQGRYQETQFYTFCKNGGVFFLDEMDASIPEVLVALNAAIANRYFDFPCGRVDLAQDCRFICAGNTFGNGADATYTGRFQLDGATLDRFAVVEVDYSREIFLAVTDNNKELVNFIYDLRKAADGVGASGLILSYRAAQNVARMEQVELPLTDCIKQCVAKGLSSDTAHMMGEKLRDGNKYAQAWKEAF